MVVWEYKVEFSPNLRNDSELVSWLNDLGADGWECFELDRTRKVGFWTSEFVGYIWCAKLKRSCSREVFGDRL